MNLNRIFFSDDEPRLRAGWRLAFQSSGMFFAFACLGVPVFVIYFFFDPTSAFTKRITPSLFLLSTVVETIAFTASIFLARRFLDKRSIESLGLKVNRQAFFDALAGIGITFLQMGFIYLVMYSLGWITFNGFAWEVDPLGKVIGSTLIFLAIFLLVGWNEELLSRGYHLQTLASGLNLFWGVVISSTVFGFLHIFNPGSSWSAVLGITLAGFYFAFAYLRSKQLWLPIGIHIGWNFFEGVVFGFPVSGMDIYPLTRIEVTGPALWTGGAFGPEAGLIVLPSLIVGAGLIYWFTRNRTEPTNV
ncbi:MAG: CPBP family intramembrane metalloprotease [Anaerolineales bacterium]|nr:CPBP family intramembrane metalloprotease [Anaerolineales bacterium]